MLTRGAYNVISRACFDLKESHSLKVSTHSAVWNITKEHVSSPGIPSRMSGAIEKIETDRKCQTECNKLNCVFEFHKVQLNYFSTQAQWMAVESLVTVLFLMNSSGWKEKQSIVREKPSHTVTFTNQYQIVFKSCKSYAQHLCLTERRAQYGPHTVSYVHAPHSYLPDSSVRLWLILA